MKQVDFNFCNNNIIRMKKIYDFIHNELLSYTLNENNIYFKLFQQLDNAANTLFVNALRQHLNLPFTPELWNACLNQDDFNYLLKFLLLEINTNKLPQEIFDDFFVLLKSLNVSPYLLLKTNDELYDIFFNEQIKEIMFV